MNSIYVALSGMRGQQTRIDTIGANLANVNTSGYKSVRVDFKDTLYAALNPPVVDAMEENLVGGTGVTEAATARNFAEGAAQETGAVLDFAISGKGFFVVQDPAEGRVYTRNGCFAVSEQGGNRYLVTAGGEYVLGDNGGRIAIPAGAAVSVSAGGVIRAGDAVVGNLAIVRFPNENGLRAVGGNTFAETENSGAPQNMPNAEIEQGMLEGSNVNLAQELTLLMRTQRAFSLASQALRTADEMEGLANRMR